MNTPRLRLSRSQNRQHGTAIVEFALVASLFFFVVLLICEFGRMLFTWNSAVEATRRGARLAIVCNQNDAAVTSAVLSLLPAQIKTADVSVSYPTDASGNVLAATVSISPAASSIQYYFPLTMGLISLSQNSWNIPSFSTTLTRESLSNGTGSNANPDC